MKKFINVVIDPNKDGLFKVFVNDGQQNPLPQEYHWGVCLERGTPKKETTEAMLNLCSAIFGPDFLSMNKKDFDSPMNEDDINLHFVEFLRSMGDMMEYLMNSTSWRDQKLHDFDALELRTRLEKMKSILR